MMFRIVEREDGSTAIFDRISGKQLSLIQSSTTRNVVGGRSAVADKTAAQPLATANKSEPATYQKTQVSL